MEVYIEEVIINNLIINFLLLKLCAFVVKTDHKNPRLLLASAFATCCSLIFPFITNVVLINIYKILLALAMVIIAYNAKKLSKILYSMLTLTIFTYALGGLIYAVGGEFSGGVFKISTRIPFALIAGLSYCFYILLKQWLNSYKRKRLKSRYIYEATFQHNGKKYSTFTYLDTGNTLVDPNDNSPITIITPKLLFQLVDVPLKTLVHMCKNEPSIPNSHYIKYKTVDAEQKMLVLKIDKISVKVNKQIIDIPNVSCGVSKTTFNKNNGCNALLNCNFLEIL